MMLAQKTTFNMFYGSILLAIVLEMASCTNIYQKPVRILVEQSNSTFKWLNKLTDELKTFHVRNLKYA